MATKKTPTFEDNLNALEEIVSQLESGQLSLDESMKAFEQGVKLTRNCQQSLSVAEQKVQILIDKNGEETLETMKPQDIE